MNFNFAELGNPRGNENPFLLTFGVLWFRWHNALAREIKKANPMWKSERIFNEARKWVIASHQSIVLNEWLPSWLGVELDEYKGIRCYFNFYYCQSEMQISKKS
jgi:dual oxidase